MKKWHKNGKINTKEKLNTGRSHFTQGYVPQKHCTNQTQHPHLKQCIFWGVWGIDNLIMYTV